jgi:hypothetical protein
MVNKENNHLPFTIYHLLTAATSPHKAERVARDF